MTRSVLIVEDNVHKFDYMKGALAHIDDLVIDHARSIRSAFRLIQRRDWDIVLLDMTFEDAEGIQRDLRKEPLAGLDVLQFLDEKRSKTSVIVVTQHDSFIIDDEDFEEEIELSKEELDEDLRNAFPRNYVGLVSARMARHDWLGLIEDLLESE